jgi:ElaB/YqjD/DUF883 family membrane-anchored ribosome-binding protein
MKTKKPSADHVQELLSDLQSLSIEAAKAVKDVAGDQAESALASLRDQFENAQERFYDLYGQAKEKTIAGAKYTDKTVRSHPYESIAIAAGVGFVVGLLISRSSKSD